MCVYPPRNLKILQISVLSSHIIKRTFHWIQKHQIRQIFSAQNTHKCNLFLRNRDSIRHELLRKWRNKSNWLCAPLYTTRPTWRDKQFNSHMRPFVPFHAFPNISNCPPLNCCLWSVHNSISTHFVTYHLQFDTFDFSLCSILCWNIIAVLVIESQVHITCIHKGMNAHWHMKPYQDN